jgi:tetratricopeptide (TPR) repeat protein
MRELSIACLLATMSFGTAARAQAAIDGAPAPARPFEEAAFDDLVVPDAEPGEQIALARALAAEGEASLARGDLETAARQLEVSYRLEPSAEVLRPLGVALAGLGRYLAAAERLERYLDEGETVAAEARRQAEEALGEARQHFATVTLLTDPPGARLSLDGRLLGASPLPAPLVLAAGEYALRAQLDGYGDAVERLAVGGGAPQELLLRLAPLGAPERRGLVIGTWVAAGVAIASAAALVAAIAMAVKLATEYDATEYPTSDQRREAAGWATASYVVAGVAGAATVTAVALAIARVRAERAGVRRARR